MELFLLPVRDTKSCHLAKSDSRTDLKNSFGVNDADIWVNCYNCQMKQLTVTDSSQGDFFH